MLPVHFYNPIDASMDSSKFQLVEWDSSIEQAPIAINLLGNLLEDVDPNLVGKASIASDKYLFSPYSYSDSLIQLVNDASGAFHLALKNIKEISSHIMYVLTMIKMISSRFENGSRDAMSSIPQLLTTIKEDLQMCMNYSIEMERKVIQVNATIEELVELLKRQIGPKRFPKKRRLDYHRSRGQERRRYYANIISSTIFIYHAVLEFYLSLG